MSTFFYGWRRKVGGVTLLVACVLMAGWLRSRVVNDYVLIPTRFAGYFLGSDQSGLCWVKSENLDFPAFWHVVQGPPLVFEFGVSHQRPGENYFDVQRSQWLGFQSNTYRGGGMGPKTRESKWVIPYWSVTIPLTLLSAYLFLWKPRKRSAT